ncbi:MAG: energy-coupling factor ABC transporter permease [Acidobacteria bacterium]|nr:energy-coupling factor ABC transporter permease [Acidobacteriota bacterium]
MLGLVHIPDGFLSASVAAASWSGAVVSVSAALAAERREPQPMSAGLLGALAAFIFAAQMVNVPVAPGTSGHLVGATLAALLVGPWRALLVMAVVLAIQALLFQDGGITAYGANLLDMGLAGTLAGYAIATLVARTWRGLRGVAAGGVVGAFAATITGATLTAVWLSLSGLYPLRALLPFMLVTHVIIGLLEAALTGGILVTILKWRPDLVPDSGVESGGRRRIALGLGLFGVAIAVAAFLAPLATGLPDGLDRTAEVLGFAGKARATWPAPLAGYRLPFATSLAAAPAVAGLVGTLAAGALAWVISRSLKPTNDDLHR